MHLVKRERIEAEYETKKNEVLSEVDHWKKRTQIKARKLHFDKHFDLVKRGIIEAEDETKKIVQGSNKVGIESANDNNGENMASDNACALNECHLRTNTSLSSRSIETEVAYRVM